MAEADNKAITSPKSDQRIKNIVGQSLIYFIHGITKKAIKEELNSGGKHIPLGLFDTLIKYSDQEAQFTFDDGFENVYLNAFPRLLAHKKKFSIFLTTDFISGKRIWTDDLAILAQDTRFVSVAGEWAKSNDSPNLGGYISYASIRVSIKNIDNRSRLRFLKYLKENIDIDRIPLHPELFQPLSIDQILEMLETGLLVLGGHTESHPILSKLTYDEQLHEIKDNKEWIEDTFRVKITDFAYPNGRLSDYNRDTLNILRKTGYLRGFTTIPAYEDSHTDPLQIPRIGIIAGMSGWKLWLISKKIYPLRG